MLIRFFTQKSLKYFIEMRDVFEELMENGAKKSMKQNEVYLSSDYIRLVGLVSHRL